MSHLPECRPLRLHMRAGSIAFALVRHVCGLIVGLSLATATLAAELHFLSLTGDGTASLSIDGKHGYLVDGGRGGRSGLSRAELEGKDPLSYLLAAGVQDLVILCSHPHADHMQGLVKPIQSRKILEFRQITFVDNGYAEESGKDSLYAGFLKAWGQRKGVSYLPAIEWKDTGGPKVGLEFAPFTGSSKTSEDPHDSAIISRYEFAAPNGSMRAVDLDDASKALIEEWRATRPQVEALVISHHGSTKNYLPDLTTTQGRQDLGLKDVIFTVNQTNQYFHPDPDVLLDVLNKFTADHVFITGSTIGQNVTITAGGISVPYDNRQHLSEFVSHQILRANAALRLLGQRAQTRLSASDIDSVLRQPDLVTALRELLSKDSAIRDSDGRRASKAKANLPLLYQALAKIQGSDSPGFEPPVIDELRQGLRARSGSAHEGSDGRKEHSELLLTQLRREPPPEAGLQIATAPPSPNPPAGGRAQVDFAKRPQLSSKLPPRPNPSSGEGVKETRFEQALGDPDVTWGGVILGNTPSGVAPRDLQILENDEDEFFLRLQFPDGTSADYTDVTTDELVAAYLFVQPDQQLLSDNPGLIGNAAGLVGFTGKREIEGGHDVAWHFALHPAIANTYLAKDGMRLDMLIATAARFSRTSANRAQTFETALPDSIRAIPWDSLKFDTYQWFDAPAEITVRDGALQVKPISNPLDCLLRVRLVTEERYPEWCHGDCNANANAELERRLGPLGRVNTNDHFSTTIWVWKSPKPSTNESRVAFLGREAT